MNLKLWWGQMASERDALQGLGAHRPVDKGAGRNSAHLVPNLGIEALKGLA